MTTFGVEYDTNILVFLPDRKLPRGVKIKIPFMRDDKLTMTLEGWRRPEEKVSNPTDCLVSLEVQMGTFNSDSSTKFNIEDFNDMCRIFTENWNNMIDRKKININGTDYDIVLYSDQGKFRDCALRIPTVGNGYTGDFFKENAVGSAQITIGIELQYVISIFAYISELYYKYIYKKKKLPSLLILSVYSAYSSTGHFCADNQIRDLDTIAFLMLINYYVNCIYVYNKASIKAYGKAYFAFKIRTNLRIIYDSIGKPEQILRKFLERLGRDNRDYVDIIGRFLQDFFNPVRGYVMGEVVRKKLEISPLTITKNSLGGFKPVDLFMAPWTMEFPEVVETSDTISYAKTPSVDFGEWNIGPNRTVYLEYRGIIATLIMIDKSSMEQYKDLTAPKFCEIISKGVDILNKGLEVDPKIILPPI